MEFSEQAQLVALGALLPLLGAAAQFWMTTRREDRVRKADRVADLHREMSTALAMVRAVLADADYDHLVVNADRDRSPLLLQDTRDKWQPARLALFAASDRHPDSEVRELSRRLTVEIHNVLVTAGWLVRAALQGKDLDHPLQRAQHDYDKAASLADQLAERVRLQTVN